MMTSDQKGYMTLDLITIKDVGVDIHYVNLLKRGWELFKRYWAILLVIWAIGFGIQMLISYSANLAENNDLLSIPVVVASIALSLIMSAGWIWIYVGMSREKTIIWKDLFSQVSVTPRFFVANLAVGLLVMLGLLLFIIPGIYWSLKYMFVPYLVIDKKTSVSEAFTLSGRLTDKILWKLIALGCVVFCFNLLGLLALGIGLLITVPVTNIAMAVLYTVLLERIGDAQKRVTTGNTQIEPPQAIVEKIDVPLSKN